MGNQAVTPTDTTQPSEEKAAGSAVAAPWMVKLGAILRRSAVAIALAFVLTQSMALANRKLKPGEPAGFWYGMAQGAIMPASFPSLILGQDVTIYAAHNTGLGYKLGYTSGVNICGAIFFGMFYRRAKRQQAAK